RRIDRDESGKVLVLGAQAVKRPRAHRGTRERRERRAGVKLDHRLRMRRGVGPQSTEEAELVHVLRQVREELRDPGARLSVLAEVEFRRGQRAAARAFLPVALVYRG